MIGIVAVFAEKAESRRLVQAGQRDSERHPGVEN